MYGYIFWLIICININCMPPVPLDPLDMPDDHKNTNDTQNEDIACTNDPQMQRDRTMRVLHYVYAYPYAIESRQLLRRRQLYKIDGDS